MSASAFLAALAACPLVAILRGVRPDEAVAVGEELVAAGFTIIEGPLNSPESLTSIAHLSRALHGRALIGAGTVIDAADITRVADAGGRLIVSPHGDVRVIKASVAGGLASVPGIFTPSEAFAAISAGATALKLFPAEASSPAALGGLLAVLPVTPVLVVGGIKPADLPAWSAVGATGFGLGSALYRPGLSPTDVGVNARAFVTSSRLKKVRR